MWYCTVVTYDVTLCFQGSKRRGHARGNHGKCACCRPLGKVLGQFCHLSPLTQCLIIGESLSVMVWEFVPRELSHSWWGQTSLNSCFKLVSSPQQGVHITLSGTYTTSFVYTRSTRCSCIKTHKTDKGYIQNRYEGRGKFHQFPK